MNPSVVIPASVQAGDRLVLFVTTAITVTYTTPAGWTLVSTVSDGTDIRSHVLTRAAAGTTAGSTLQLTLSAQSKTSLVVAAYSGTSGVTAFASAAEPGPSPTTHTAPTVNVATTGSTVLRYWADKGSTAHGWTLPAGVTARASTTGSGGGLLTAALGDTAAAPTGAAGTAVGNAGVASGKAIAWSIVLGP